MYAEYANIIHCAPVVQDGRLGIRTPVQGTLVRFFFVFFRSGKRESVSKLHPMKVDDLPQCRSRFSCFFHRTYNPPAFPGGPWSQGVILSPPG